MDRTGLEFHFVFAKTRTVHNCHLDNIHGSGASPLRLPVNSRPSIHDATGFVNGSCPPEPNLWMQSCLRTREARASRRRPHGNDAEYQDFRFSIRIHMSSSSRSPVAIMLLPLETLKRIRPRHLEMEPVQMVTGCTLTLSRKVREWAKVKTNTREEVARPARPLQTSTRARIVATLDNGPKTAGILVEERVTIPPTEVLAKARVKTQVKGKANTWTLSKQNNFSPSQDPSVVGKLSCISSVDPWIMGVTLNSVSSTRRQAGAEYLLLDSGAQLHACPLTYPGQKIPSPDPGIHTASGARLQHDRGRLTNFQQDEQSEYFSTCVLCRNQFCLLAVSLTSGTGVIFVQTLVHCSFLTRPRRKVATHSCTRKSVCSLSKGRWLRP